MRSNQPGDLIRPVEAISILAGRRLAHDSTVYMRYWQRLDALAAAGRVSRTYAGRHARYRRAEIETLKRAHHAEGITPRSTRRRRLVAAAAKHAEPGLVGIAELAGHGVSADTAAYWGRQGYYGAVKVGGCWFFDRALVEARPARAKRTPSGEVRCAICGDPLKRKASHVQRARDRAAAAGREAHFFCDKHSRTPEARALIAQRPRGKSPREHEPNVSAAVRKQWQNGKRNKTTAAERMKQTVDAICKSPQRFPAREHARIEALYGHGLSEEQRAEAASRALSRAQRDSDRSRAARVQEEQLVALWPTGASVPQIAGQLDTTPSWVKETRRRLGLPPRQPGRRPSKK